MTCLTVAAECRGSKVLPGRGRSTLGHLHFALRHEYHSQRHFNTQRLIFATETKCVSCEAGTRSPHIIHINFELPWLARPVAGLSLRRSLFHPEPVHEQFLVAQVPLGKFPCDYFCCPLVSTSPAMINTLLHLNNALSEEQLGKVSKPSN